jgi:hypothetical protein
LKKKSILKRILAWLPFWRPNWSLSRQWADTRTVKCRLKKKVMGSKRAWEAYFEILRTKQQKIKPPWKIDMTVARPKCGLVTCSNILVDPIYPISNDFTFVVRQRFEMSSALFWNVVRIVLKCQAHCFEMSCDNVLKCRATTFWNVKRIVKNILYTAVILSSRTL